MKIPIIYNVRSVLRRPATSASTAAGIALVVLTFVGMLALANGFRAALIETGRPDNVLVLRGGADAELSSGISRQNASIIKALPYVARAADGRPLASADVFVVVTMDRFDGSQANVPVRGVDFEAFELRNDIRVVEGRMIEPGRPEVVVGKGLAGRVEGAAVGDRMRFGQREWTVVGVFEAGGGAFESEVWGENELLMTAFRGPVYQSVTFRLADPAQFDEAVAALRDDPRLEVDVYRESEFYAGQSELLGNILRFLAIFVTSIMAVGAVFGAVNTMDAMVRNRTREIAVLLTLGFRPRSVLASFLLESLIIALVGGVIGCLLALPINGITTSTTNFQSFAELVFAFRITPGILAQGLVFAAVMGVLGGFVPARRAARQAIATALRME